MKILRSARELAKENYEHNKNNPYHIQAYLKSVMYDEKSPDNKNIIRDLLQHLAVIDSDRAREMYLEELALFYAFYEDDESSSIETISEANKKFPNSVYPYFTKFEICEKFNRKSDMKQILDYLDKIVKEGSYFYNAFLKYNAIFQAKIGDIKTAMDFIGKIKNYPSHAIEKLINKIREIYST